MTDGSPGEAGYRRHLEAVRRLVPMLLERGYEFETVTRLLCQTT